MKTRVTFRIAEDLAESLRALPNQTHFVETVLRDALGATCPTCDGTGRVRHTSLRLPNFKAAALPSLDRDTALQLKAIVRLARRVSATNLDLRADDKTQGLGFSMRREDRVLLQGRVGGDPTGLSIH